jgi:hypothetical protein
VYWKKGFRIMCKKLLIAAVAVVVGLVLVKNTSVGSYARVWWKNARACASRQVPVETEIERLRDELSRIGEDSTSHYRAIAQEMVAVQNLKEKIADHEIKLEGWKKNIITLKDDLASGNQSVSYGGTRYSRESIKARLASEFEAFKASEEGLKAERKLLEARENNLAAAKDQVRAMQQTRRDLEVALARLEAEYKTVRVAQTRSKFHLDDSSLSRLKKSVAELRDRVKVEQTTLALQAEYTGGPSLQNEEAKEKDLLKAIDNHFEADKRSDKVTAQK